MASESATGWDVSDDESDDRTPEEVAADIDHPILLFDGVCNLCNGLVRFVVKFDAEGRYRFAPLQSDVGRLLQERFDLDPDDVDTVVLVDGDEHYLKSDAILRVMRHLDGPWPLLAPLRYLPRVLRDGGYDVVAATRYRVFGKKDACPVPAPEIRDRFANRTFD
jgi:predicted DCC family thiol-disulfide oxidoreductase YuxK